MFMLNGGRVSGKIIFVFIEIGQLEDTEVEVDEWPLLNLFSFLSQIEINCNLRDDLNFD